MSTANACFVQFPHPGKEHEPATDAMPWNTGDHRRKFLVAPGRSVDMDGNEDKGELVFWGEWEPPSRVKRRWPANGRMPQALHRPYWAQPRGRGFRQNTDPWVFGERMIYSVCKQLAGKPQPRPTSLQYLARGSVICFGSTIDGQFCLDTVFVVASAEPWVPAELGALDLDPAFKTCTARSVATREDEIQKRLTLYRGATVNDPVGDMFSFVPARRANADEPRFRRPPVESPFINPRNRQSTWGSKRPLPMQALHGAWTALRDQVFESDLLLATWLQTPDYEEADIVIRDSTHQHC